MALSSTRAALSRTWSATTRRVALDDGNFADFCLAWKV